MSNILPFAKSARYDNAALALSAMPLTMTSREISDVTGKEHKHVLFDTRKMLVELEKDEPSFRRIYLDTQNRQQTEYVLDEVLTLALVTGYSAKMRLAIIERWKELEAMAKPAAPALPQDYLQALEHLVAVKKSELLAIEHVAKLEVVVAEQAIKVDAHNLLTDSDGSMTVTEAAKNLQVKPMVLTKHLRDDKWIYKSGASYLAFQARIDAGLMMHKITLVEVHGSGETIQRYATQARVTVKGLAKLSLEFSKK